MAPSLHILLVPSRAPDTVALRELPRRLVLATGQAQAGLLPLRILDLARAIAEPHLMGRGLGSWNSGHAARLAGHLLRGSTLRVDPALPRAPAARALAATLRALRVAGVAPQSMAELALTREIPEDAERLRSLAGLHERFEATIDAGFADPVAVFREARRRLPETPWLDGADALLVDDAELEPPEEAFLAALARRIRVELIERPQPVSLRASAFVGRAAALGIEAHSPDDGLLAPVLAASRPAGLERLRERLFDAPGGRTIADGSVELLTAPGEGAEVRSLVRRLLREARRGVPFEEMGVILPRPDTYAPLLADELSRLGLPFRLHPSLPLDTGRIARSILLLFRCRELPRAAVMEFLTFAPVPFAELLGPEVDANPARWDALSRDAGIVSGRERWTIGLRAHAEAERDAASREENEGRRRQRLRRADECDALLRVVSYLASALELLSGEASWEDWSRRLLEVFAAWVVREDSEEYERVRQVVDELTDLGRVSTGEVPWNEVEEVVESRFELDRRPLEPVEHGAVHVGAFDAMAGLDFRVVMIPGLVEGGFPGPLHPDPFLLDDERRALAGLADEGAVAAPEDPDTSPPRQAAPAGKRATSAPGAGAQLSLFGAESAREPAAAGPQATKSDLTPARLPTSQDRLVELRRLFHRALSQATERLYLSYPRADPRTGRERLPSLFLMVAASTLEGRVLGAEALAQRIVEDDLERLDVDDALDRGERDRVRLLHDREAAEEAIASGSAFFRQSRLAAQARWQRRLTPYDGLVAPLAPELATQLDPVASGRPVSATRLSTFMRCGFLYLLQYVLRLQPTLEPEERRRLDPLERGNAFHESAERFLRERRDAGALPIRNTEEEQERLLEIGDAALDELVQGTPPRFTLLWERERRQFRELLLKWLQREAVSAERGTPAHFEVGFGVRDGDPGEPHLAEPIEIDLGQGRRLRVTGKIDRIDRREDGSLVLRDYKTGRAPRDDGRLFHGGKQLQVPFYVLAAESLFPGSRVAEAFLDYVDGGRIVSLDLERVRGEGFRSLLDRIVSAMSSGVFAQEPSACEWCDYTEVCGPRGLLHARRQLKRNDRLLLALESLRGLG